MIPTSMDIRPDDVGFHMQTSNSGLGFSGRAESTLFVITKLFELVFERYLMVPATAWSILSEH